MEFNFNEIMITLVPQLGFGAIFLWLFTQERKQNADNILNRDVRIKELTEGLISLTKQNVEALTQFKDVVQQNTQSMQTNTNSLQSLASKIDYLVNGNKKPE